jgi:cellulose synthase/poly-beta-1,6-N-acetylglucosamine synthase-like glycosyltransferase/peptidoglycan/xylan/chitin deacetylase (PgdA/CDA1 family)/spore germination protein YaaH
MGGDQTRRHMTKHPIFFDPKNRRAGHVSRVAWTLAIMSSVAGIVFLSSIFIFRSFPEALQTSPSQRYALLNDVAKIPHLLPSVRNLARKAQSTKRKYPHAVPLPALTGPKTKGVRAPVERRDKPLTVGFYANWDDSSFASLRNNIQNLDWVVPSWLYLQGSSMDLKVTLDAKALDLIRREKPGAEILAMIQNSFSNTWDGPNLGRLMADPVQRRERLERIVAFIEANKLQGIVVDFEQIPDDAHKDTLAFLGEMRAAFKPRGWLMAIAAPFDDPHWNYKAYAKTCDYLMLMGYDEHWSAGDPGPVSSQSWFATRLAARMRDLDPARTIVAIANYGYDWVSGGKYADDLTFQEVMLTARDAKATIDLDAETLNPRFSYLEDGKTHRVWFLDAVTAYNHLRAADKFRPAGYALWRLGAEDPSIWQVLPRSYGAPPPASLETITPTADVNFIGRGELLQIAAEPTPGSRTFKADEANATITAETYTKMPASFVIRRGGEMPGKIALTFDDGPDEQWTPKILDILKAKGVHATFFIIGENGAAHPRLVQRILAEGHDLGNHTYTHPNLGEMPDSVAGVELNATQRLIEALTGRSTRLFRPPYFGDAEPTSAQEIAPMEEAERLGYLTVGLKVDPDDWQKPSAQQIVERVIEQATDPDLEKRGQIVLLHDAGGDRSSTVAALPTLIDALIQKGMGFVTVSELAKWTKDQAMPPVPANDASPVVNRYVFFTFSWLQEALATLFLVAIALGVGRLLVLCGLALFGAVRSKRRGHPDDADHLSVSVLIPAYNEAKVIAVSIGKILASTHTNLKIIVIDDGSTDGTSAVVSDAFGADPRVTLITAKNAGKARAVNLGLSHADGDIVVVLDADTQFEPRTISRLVRWFADPKIGAVAGNAKVGNRLNMLTRWQALEYITAQNLERRALATLGCITVVPGAVGAWRRDAVAKLGGFPSNTLAEDQDLTIMIQREGFKVRFDQDAVAWTEAPDTMAGLAKQRFRWAFGTLQCLWKHRRVNLNPHYGTLGLVAMPQVWLFQIILALVSPLVDLLLLYQIARAFMDYLQHGEQFNSANLMVTASYYAVFMAVDLSAAAIAFFLEKKEDRSLLWWLMLQRFGYRQIMYYVVVKSVLKALQGRVVGWGKLERKATVKTAEAEEEGAPAVPIPGKELMSA